MTNDKDIKLENALVMYGDAMQRLKELPDNSVDSIVTDPPYGLSDNKFVAETIAKWINGERDFIPDGKGFMGKAWDSFVPPPAIWDECLRVLKPGGHLLAFFGSRTQDVGALSIRLAGFEIRDSVAWVYGSGFPKSLDISKAIDKQAGAERKVVGKDKAGKSSRAFQSLEETTAGEYNITAPATDAAKKYEGWGTALKPAHEPIVVARKPLSESTIANNVLQWGTGGLNIDASRIGSEVISTHNAPKGTFAGGEQDRGSDTDSYKTHTGRFPANFILSHTEDCVETGDVITSKTSAGNRTATFGTQETVSGGDGSGGFDGYEYTTPVFRCAEGCPVAELDKQSGVSKSSKGITTSSPTALGQNSGWNAHENKPVEFENYGDKGGASRFFYVAKASKKDRNEGLDDLPTKQVGTYAQDEWSKQNMGNTPDAERKPVANFHPTVKPTQLMEYLVRLVTPEGGTVLDPFTGSGSTGKAALLNGFKFIGCELTEDYLPIIEGRLRFAEVARHKPLDDSAGKKPKKIKKKVESSEITLFDEEL